MVTLHRTVECKIGPIIDRHGARSLIFPFVTLALDGYIYLNPLITYDITVSVTLLYLP